MKFAIGCLLILFQTYTNSTCTILLEQINITEKLGEPKERQIYNFQERLQFYKIALQIPILQISQQFDNILLTDWTRIVDPRKHEEHKIVQIHDFSGMSLQQYIPNTITDLQSIC